MGFQKGHIPHNKSNNLIFYEDYLIYNENTFFIDNIKKLYLEDNIQKKEILKILNIPEHIFVRIQKHYDLWKPKSLSHINVIANTDYEKSVINCKKTKFEKYGDENYNNREKAKETCLKKYGEDNIFKTDKFKTDMVALNQQKYGCDYNSQSQEIKDKKKKTCQEKFGVDSPLQSDTVKEKIKETNIKKFGVKYPTQSELVMEKQKETNLLKYGREYGFDYDKSKEYFLNKYGVEYYTQTLEYHQKARKHYTYNNNSFDSFPELCVYIYALENNIPVERNPIKFIYIYEGKNHIYIPDFKYGEDLIEIKGNHFFENNKMINPFDRTQDGLYEAKHQCGINNNVKFWTEDDYKFAIDYFNRKNYRRQAYEN